MNLTAQKIPDQFVRSIPRGFRLVSKAGLDFLLIDSLFCPKGHSLVVDSVRIHDEPSIKLKIDVNHESGFVFVDAFWGSHAKLFGFLPQISGTDPTFADASCPYCLTPLMENYLCTHQGCRSERSIRLMLPGGKNQIHVCARLGCPGHVLDILDMPEELVRSISIINYFGACNGELFGNME